MSGSWRSCIATKMRRIILVELLVTRLNVFVGIGAVWLLLVAFAPAELKETKIYLLKDDVKEEWCAFANEPEWRAAVQNAGSMMVGTVIYSGQHLSKVDVTETDQTGDWTVYD